MIPEESLSRLDALVDALAAQMKRKLRKSAASGRSGWSDPKWSIDDVKKTLMAHIEKGDPIDVANFAAFWWFKADMPAVVGAPKTAAVSETYPMPAKGWTCFHCGETFKTPGAARDHFGFAPSSEPGCRIKIGAERGLLMALRKAEEEIARNRDEDGPAVAVIMREMRAMQGRHSDALRAAEELGYERGLNDGRALPPT
jgi:hypothetical protein